MASRHDTVEAGGVTPSAAASPASGPPPSVAVWDPFVRLFHWSLVGLFALAFATGDRSEAVHVATGLVLTGLLALRILWGFVGPRHARFGDFVRTPRAVLRYMGLAVLLRAPRHLGHNPAGGAMVVALLAVLGGIAATGIAMTTDALWGQEWLEDLHEGLVFTALGLVALHVAGVVFASFAHGENLVKAMLTGRKRAS